MEWLGWLLTYLVLSPLLVPPGLLGGSLGVCLAGLTFAYGWRKRPAPLLLVVPGKLIAWLFGFTAATYLAWKLLWDGLELRGGSEITFYGTPMGIGWLVGAAVMVLLAFLLPMGVVLLYPRQMPAPEWKPSPAESDAQLSADTGSGSA